MFLLEARLAYLAELQRKRSANAISRFSSKLFKVGSTFRSAFSIPSSIKIEPAGGLDGQKVNASVGMRFHTAYTIC